MTTQYNKVGRNVKSGVKTFNIYLDKASGYQEVRKVNPMLS